MSCSPFDLKDYLFGELSEKDSLTLRNHVGACSGCREELERLRLTHTALTSLRDEEMPRRIAFVSDKVFEPNWWHRFWQSGPRLAFASAAILSLAILTHAITRPAPVAAPAAPDIAAMEARIEAEVAQRIPAAVQQAVAQMEQRQDQKLMRAVADSEKKIEFQRRADIATFDENFKLLSSKVRRIERDSYSVASLGATQ